MLKKNREANNAKRDRSSIPDNNNTTSVMCRKAQENNHRHRRVLTKIKINGQKKENNKNGDQWPLQRANQKDTKMPQKQQERILLQHDITNNKVQESTRRE